MKNTSSCLFRATRLLRHENPLGLPKTGTPPRFQRGLPTKRPIPSVSHIIAVSSAKGGVGKSTIAANLSLAFARLGLRSGILDVDIFGPSIPTLFNLHDTAPQLSPANQLLPLTAYGVKTMSIGYLVGEASAVVWRGPMLLKAVQQLLHDVAWGGLDVLVLDLPPGTGDAQLSVAQQVELDGAVVVTTPHALAVRDAVKGMDMFDKMGVPVLGLVQNMGVFACPHCRGETAVFGGSERVKRVCDERGLEFLGDVPLHENIGEDASRGKPTVVAEPESERAKVFMDMARRIGDKIGLEVGG